MPPDNTIHTGDLIKTKRVAQAMGKNQARMAMNLRLTCGSKKSTQPIWPKISVYWRVQAASEAKRVEKSTTKAPMRKAALAPAYALEKEAMNDWEEETAASRLDLSMASIDASNDATASHQCGDIHALSGFRGIGSASFMRISLRAVPSQCPHCEPTARG